MRKCLSFIKADKALEMGSSSAGSNFSPIDKVRAPSGMKLVQQQHLIASRVVEGEDIAFSTIRHYKL
jgi:hypothetical protein